MSHLRGKQTMQEGWKDRVTIVIPAKNEERSIGDIVRAASAFAKEVIVIDGHSSDKTREIAQAAGARVLSDRGKGKGDAIRGCVSEVRTDVIVFLDADGSHFTDDIPELISPIFRGECDHVSASRLLGGSSELHGGFDEFFRLMGSSFITACINWWFGVRLSDSQNGFRAIRKEVLKALELRENITTIEQEMIIKTLKKGYRMGEIPSHEYRRRFGKSNIRLGKVWFRYGYSLIKYLLV